MSNDMRPGWVVQERGTSRWGKVEEVADGKALVRFRGASLQWVPVADLFRI